MTNRVPIPPSRPATCCDIARIDILLHGEEGTAEWTALAEHVESCAACRERLVELAGAEHDWAEVRDALQPRKAEDHYPVPHPRSIRLDFLAPPSHPEMLGRLGRYEIERVIGAGGMGVVLKGFDTELNRPVAIKVLASHLADCGAARQRFAREARAAAAVVHEHVVAIHNVESEEEVPFLVMQFVAGQSLQDRVDEDGPLTSTEILRIGMQAAAGLAAAHAQGLIHRDVKPANILLESGIERALLTDFGLARAADDAGLTRSGVVAGTPHYMSPEQARGEPAEARSDLFSLGAVLYFMATGHPPFRADQAMAVLHRVCHEQHRPLWKVGANISSELEDVIDRLLEKKPSRRFATASEVHQALTGALSRLQLPKQARWRDCRRWLKRRHSQLRIMSAALVGISALAVANWPFDPFPPQRESEGKPLTVSSEQTSQRAVELLVSELGTQRSAFVNELSAIDESLENLVRRMRPESPILEPNRDRWLRELRAAEAGVMTLERSWSIDSRIPRNLDAGEMP